MRISVLVLVAAIAAAPSFAASTEIRPATDAEIVSVKAGMQDQLKDADSAKLRNVRVMSEVYGLRTICGDVNAKNGYGAYIGYTTFLGTMDNQSGGGTVTTIIGIDEEVRGAASAVCERMASDH